MNHEELFKQHRDKVLLSRFRGIVVTLFNARILDSVVEEGPDSLTLVYTLQGEADGEDEMASTMLSTAINNHKANIRIPPRFGLELPETITGKIVYNSTV